MGSVNRCFFGGGPVSQPTTTPADVASLDRGPGIVGRGRFYRSLHPGYHSLCTGLDPHPGSGICVWSAAYLESMVDRFGPLPPARVIMLLRQACRSLSEAHEVGLVHRDIKPANLFICKLGREYDFLKVLDFGIVKGADIQGETLITSAGKMVGTPAYMAPELIAGGEVDGRADLYALGCVGYWMLTGRKVFESENLIQMAMHHARTPPEPPSKVAEISVPESLDKIVLACLLKTPDDRPSSADELWQVLGQIGVDDSWPPEHAEAWWRLHLPELAVSRPGMATLNEISE